MGYNARNDEIRDNITRMKREWEAQRGALATVRRFNATLSAKGYSWFWPKIAAALVSKHHWLVIACDNCDRLLIWTCALSRVIPKLQCVLRSAMCDVRAAAGTAGRASLLWRGTRRFEPRIDRRTMSAGYSQSLREPVIIQYFA